MYRLCSCMEVKWAVARGLNVYSRKSEERAVVPLSYRILLTKGLPAYRNSLTVASLCPLPPLSPTIA